MFMKDDFYNNILKMFTGTVGSYMFWALAMLVVGRLYSPEYFGGGQLFVSAASILSVVATGRYETALTIPKFHFQAIQLFFFSVALSTACTVVAFLLLIGFCEVLVDAIGISAETLFLVPVYALELCWYVLSYGWAVRTKKYAVAARGLILFPLSYLILCVGFCNLYVPVHKLALATILARGMAILYYGWYCYKDMKGFVGRIAWRALLRKGREYVDFPQKLLLSNFLGMISAHAVPFLVASFWGMEATGYYSMAMQVLAAPTGLIGKSVGDVFKQEGAILYRKYGECKRFYQKNLRLCLGYSVFVCACAYVAIPALLPMFLGEKWNIVGEYVRWMLPMTFLSLVDHPLSQMYIIARRQMDYLVIQIMMLLAAIVGLGGGGRYGCKIGGAILLWGMLSVVVQFMSIRGGWAIAKGNRNVWKFWRTFKIW